MTEETKDNTIVFPFKMKPEATDASAVPEKKISPEEAGDILAAAVEEGRRDAAMDSTRQHVEGPATDPTDVSGAPMKQAPEEQEQQSVKINPKAIVTWYNEDGTIQTQETTYRSFPVLADFLADAVELGRSVETKVEIHLQLIDSFIKPRPGDADQKPRTKLTIRSGKVGEVIEYLNAKTTQPQAVLMNLQALIYSLADVSTLKGLIVSVVMADARAAGFGFISESIEVTDQDIQVLAAASAAQTDMFKTKMKASRKIEFPDESPIVAASQGELLKLTNGRGAKG